MTTERAIAGAVTVICVAAAAWSVQAPAAGAGGSRPRARPPALGHGDGGSAGAQGARVRHRPRRRRRHLRGPAAATPPASLPATDPRALSSHPVAEDSSWQRYVLDPQSPVVYPKAVSVDGAGTVDNPNGLLEGGGGATIHATGSGNPTVTLDLGVDTGGRVEVGISKTDGTEVDLAYAEQRQYLNSQGDNTAGSLGNDDNPDGRTDAIKASGPTQFVSPGIRGGERWISLTLHGAGTVTIDYVRVRYDGYRPAVGDYVGHFLSSDDVLNRVWYGGAYTFDLDSIRDVPLKTPTVVVDGAKRDRLVWLGDLGLETLTASYIAGQAPSTIRDSIDMFSCQQYADGYIAMASDIYVTCPPQPPSPQGPPPSTQQTNTLIRYGHLPEYTAWWVIAEYESMLYQGDLGRARVLLPVLRHALDYMVSNIDSNGLFHTGTNDNIFPINWHPFDVASGDDTHTNATWVLALRDMADLERRVGDPVRAAADDNRAVAITDAMIAHLWDPAAGAFVLNTQDPNPNHTQDGNVEAVLAGVIPGVRGTEALSYIEQHLETPYGPLNGESTSDPYMSEYISPYISSWELLARFERHDGSGALSLMRRLYGYMATHDPASTLWEKVGPDGNPASYQPNQVGNALIPPNASVVGAGAVSLSHGWSTGPVSALSAYVLGLRPTAPGWATWTVEPQPVDLRWAQGQAGTPRGPIVSRWERGPGDSTFRLTVEAPAGTTGTVAVPLLGASDRTIARDGQVVWQDGGPAGGARARLGPGAVVFDAGPGTHSYAWGPLSASTQVRCSPRASRRRRARSRRPARPGARRSRARRPRRRAHPSPACGRRSQHRRHRARRHRNRRS